MIIMLVGLLIDYKCFYVIYSKGLLLKEWLLFIFRDMLVVDCCSFVFMYYILCVIVYIYLIILFNDRKVLV